MIKKLSQNKTVSKIAIAQIDYDLSDPLAIEVKRQEAIAKAEAEGADFIAIGGESGCYEDENIIIITSDEIYKRDCFPAKIASYIKQASFSKKPLIYAGATGIRDGGKAIRVYNGGSAYFSPDGKYYPLAPRFGEWYGTVEPASPAYESIEPPASEDFDTTAEAVIYGTRTFLHRLALDRIVIGLSGGIDSAVTAALYGSILPPENILLIGMPGPFTSKTTRNLARELASNLGARFAEIPISDSVDLTIKQFCELKSEGPGGGIAGAWELSPFAVENVQARDRGSRILCAAAAAFGGVVSCNANKDEITVGYGTQYGDIIGWLATLGDLWKGDVYRLGAYLNEKVYGREIIPDGIFSIKPSAELSANQSVDKGLGDPLVYPYHDKLFRAWIEEGDTPEKQLERYLDGTLADTIGFNGDLQSLFPDRDAFYADLARWWNLYKGLAVAKRIQAPPVLAVSERAFGEFPEYQSSKRI